MRLRREVDIINFRHVKEHVFAVYRHNSKHYIQICVRWGYKHSNIKRRTNAREMLQK